MTNKDVKQLLARAQAKGWQYAGVNGRDHYELIWPATGQTCTIPSTPNATSLRNTEHWLATISGPLTDPPGPGRTREERRADTDRRKRIKRQRIKPCGAPELPDWRQQLQSWSDEHLEAK